MADAAGSRKRSVITALVILAMAIPPSLNSVGNPHLAGLRGPDILRLIAIGFCVGVAFGIFAVEFIGRRRSG
jgi:hypothetical protein